MKKWPVPFRILCIFAIALVVIAAAGVTYAVVRQKTNALSSLFASKEKIAPPVEPDSNGKALLDKDMAALNPETPSGPLNSQSDPVSTTLPSPTGIPGSQPADVMDFLILGVDSRNFQLDTQTDMIMVVRVDRARNDIKIASISRDVYLSIPGFDDNRINEANVYGGPELVVKTINEAFGLNIRQYAVFDFKTAEEIVDMFGKVTVTVNADELDELNTKIKELNGLSKNTAPSPLVTHPGSQELDGRQAVAYARLRPDQGSDIVRTTRQRAVLLSLMKTAKQMKSDQILSLAGKAADLFYTNIPLTQIPSLATELYAARNGAVEQLSIPADGTYREESIVQMKFLVIDLKENSYKLNDFLNNR
jgi:LCP family protein required for cell wall assembly